MYPVLFISVLLHHWLSLANPSWYQASAEPRILQGIQRAKSSLDMTLFSSWLPTSSGLSVLTVKPLKWRDGVLFYLGTFAMSVILLDTCLSPTIVLLHNTHVVALCSSPQPIHSSTQSLLKKKSNSSLQSRWFTLFLIPFPGFRI